MSLDIVRIEELAPCHLEALSKLFADIVASGDEAVFHPHPLTATEAARLCHNQTLDCYFVTMSGGAAVAYGILRGWEEGYKEPSLGVAIHPRRHRQGLGRQMSDFLIDVARRRGAASLRLTVYSDNEAAVGLYKKLGFSLTRHSEGKLLGRLDLLGSSAYVQLSVGVCADMLLGWAGGADLLVMTIRAMHATEPANRILLLVPGNALAEPKFTWKSFRFAIKDAVKALIGRPRMKHSPEITQSFAVSELIGRLRAHVPTLEVRHSAGLDEGLAQAAAELHLDAVYLTMRLPSPRPDCALIGYVPDYQHRHLPHLFSFKELALRDEVSGRLISASDAMVMNARAAAKDMRRFAAGPLPLLYALPFAPSLNPEWLRDRPELLTAYAITGPYFIVCNQFWVHKDHLTAMRAMAEVAKIHPDVVLICTGSTTDYRDPTYFRKLEAEAAKLDLGARLRFLGHIPKRDQIELLKCAVALVQPTLFEGGPGGGSTYEAVALGQRVLLSDLPVNREADSGDIRFFPRGDHIALAALMSDALDDAPSPIKPTEMIAMSEASLRRYGEGVWASIRGAVASRNNRQT